MHKEYGYYLLKRKKHKRKNPIVVIMAVCSNLMLLLPRPPYPISYRLQRVIFTFLQ